jgi:hypothetical protein
LLGIDPAWVVNISSSVGSEFKKDSYSDERRQNLLSSYNIAKDFILYVLGREASILGKTSSD